MYNWRETYLPPVPGSLLEWDEILQSDQYLERGTALAAPEEDADGVPFYRGVVNGHSLLFVSEAMRG